MIKLFNKNRKNSLSENRFGKYILYAIGEIILVVIGILIALQINTTNQNKNQTKKTHTYLRALNTEIETNIRYLEGNIKTNHDDLIEAAETLKALNSEDAINYNDSMLLSVMPTRPVFKATLFRSTFDDLINSGTLEYLEDVALKNNIFMIEARLEQVNSSFENARKVWDDHQLPYLQKYSNTAGNWDEINGVEIVKPPFKRDKIAFIYNRDYANLLVLRMRMVGNYEERLISVKQKFELLSDDIKAYLEEKE